MTDSTFIAVAGTLFSAGALFTAGHLGYLIGKSQAKYAPKPKPRSTYCDNPNCGKNLPSMTCQQAIESPCCLCGYDIHNDIDYSKPEDH